MIFDIWIYLIKRLNFYRLSFNLSLLFRCNVSLRGNGLKVLTANSFIPSDTPVIECRGKYMLNNPGLIKVKTRAVLSSGKILTKLLPQASKNNPYVLQHKLNNELEVLVDGTTYGNDSR